MARKGQELPASRSQFVRDILGSNKQAKHREVVEAWVKAGFPESQAPSGSLFQQIKRKEVYGLGRTNKKKVVPSEVVSDKQRSYAEIESILDQLVSTASNIGDKRLVESIRTARRYASVQLV